MEEVCKNFPQCRSLATSSLKQKKNQFLKFLIALPTGARRFIVPGIWMNT